MDISPFYPFSAVVEWFHDSHHIYQQSLEPFENEGGRFVFEPFESPFYSATFYK